MKPISTLEKGKAFTRNSGLWLRLDDEHDGDGLRYCLCRQLASIEGDEITWLPRSRIEQLLPHTMVVPVHVVVRLVEL